MNNQTLRTTGPSNIDGWPLDTGLDLATPTATTLQRENARLRRQNQQLLEDARGRRQTAARVLEEMVSGDSKQLASLLLAMLSDPPETEDRAADTQTRGSTPDWDRDALAEVAGGGGRRDEAAGDNGRGDATGGDGRGEAMAHRRSTTAVAPRSAEEADAGPRPSADAEKRPWDSPRLGSLAASLLDPAQPRDPRLRFLLHSPAGVLEAATLAELRTGSITLADIVARGGFWLDIADPTPSEMAAVARVFRIHPLTVEDILADDGRDKLESFHGYSFLAYRTIDRADSRSSYEFNTTDGLATAGFALVLKPSCVLTFHRGGLEHTDNTVARLRGLAHSTPTYIAYALVDDITDSLAPEMRALELEVDAVDELVLILSTNEQSDMLRRIGAARRKILTVWRLLQGKPEAIRALAKLVDASEPIDIARYLDDVHDHLVSLTASVAHCDLVLARAHSNYLARLSLELGESTVATNLFASRWTVIGAILVPLNVITGLWGMNVKVPGQDRDDTRDFFLILAGCLLFVALVIVWARCKRIF